MLHLLHDVTPTSSVTIRLPDGSRLRSTHRGYFDHPTLPPEARRVYIFANLAHALFSVSQFCRAGAIATFTKDALHITMNGDSVFNGYANGKLWFTDLEPPNLTTAEHHSPIPDHSRPELPESAMLVQPELRGTNAQRIRFYQRTLCHPARSTMYNAARYLDAFRTFPHLTPRLISQHYELDEQTASGRLDRTRKNYASTRAKPTSPLPVPADDYSPIKPEGLPHSEPTDTTTDYDFGSQKPEITASGPKPNPTRIHPAGRTTVYTQTRRMYTDLSGRLESSFYILVMYFQVINVIFGIYL